MLNLNRRGFLGTSFGGVAAALTPRLLTAADQQTSQPAFDPGTLFLTWQQDPTTTICIQWVGEETAGTSEIHYAPAAEKPMWQIGKVRTKPFPDTDLKVHRCDLADLQAGMDYQFQIGADSPVYRFRTMPAKATNTLTFVSGGDAGTGSAAMQTNLLAAKQDPYFALIGGDLAYDNGRSAKTFYKFLENYRQTMVDSAGRLIPLIACIGNHEVDGGYKGERRHAAHYLSVFDGLYAEQTYGVLDIGDYLSIVLLDTGHIAPITGEQTDWLSQTLQERQSRPHLIVANHVPAYPSVRSFANNNGKPGTGEEQRTHWSPLFERFHVDLVLEHHDHAFKRTHPLIDGRYDKHGVLYLGDGSWGKIRPVEDVDKRPYLAAASSAYHVTVHRLEGEQRFHVAMADGGRVADVCMTAGKRPAR